MVSGNVAHQNHSLLTFTRPQTEVTNLLQFAGASLDTLQLPAAALPGRCSVFLEPITNTYAIQVSHSQAVNHSPNRFFAAVRIWSSLLGVLSNMFFRKVQAEQAVNMDSFVQHK